MTILLFAVEDDGFDIFQVVTGEPKSDIKIFRPRPATNFDPKSQAEVDFARVHRFLGGDSTAFDELVRHYRDKIFVTTFQLLKNRSDAEEITQDTFIRAHRGLANFRGDSSVSTWLYRIALNLSRNRYWHSVRRGLHINLSMDAPLTDDADAAPFSDLLKSDELDPANEAELVEETSRISVAMEKLPPHHRRVLNLLTVQHRSYEEIATALGVNVGTVKSRISRARQSLHDLLGA